MSSNDENDLEKDEDAYDDSVGPETIKILKDSLEAVEPDLEFIRNNIGQFSVPDAVAARDIMQRSFSVKSAFKAIEERAKVDITDLSLEELDSEIQPRISGLARRASEFSEMMLKKSLNEAEPYLEFIRNNIGKLKLTTSDAVKGREIMKNSFSIKHEIKQIEELQGKVKILDEKITEERGENMETIREKIRIQNEIRTRMTKIPELASRATDLAKAGKEFNEMIQNKYQPDAKQAVTFSGASKLKAPAPAPEGPKPTGIKPKDM